MLLRDFWPLGEMGVKELLWHENLRGTGIRQGGWLSIGPPLACCAYTTGEIGETVVKVYHLVGVQVLC